MTDRDQLRADLDALCAWERGPCSDGEAAAAAWLADRLREEGADAQVIAAHGYPSYAGALATLMGTAMLAGTMARGRRSPRAALAAAVAGALLVDDVENGRRLFRRATGRRRPTQNVVATIGNEDAPRTLVVLAHHDAAPTGLIFDQRLPRALLRVTGADGRSAPFWWPVVAGPALVALGAALGLRRTTRAGTVVCALATAGLLDIARDRIVPGANDNGTACVALLALARRFRSDPPPTGVRVLLVSCGAEEALQGGVHPFVATLRGDEHVLVLDTVGAERLVLVEGEGELVMEDYTDPSFRDRVARVAERAGIALERGRRLWVSTDAVVPSRAGHPTATLVAVDAQGLLPDYHLPSDTPANVDLDGLTRAIDLTEALARDLGAEVEGR